MDLDGLGWEAGDLLSRCVEVIRRTDGGSVGYYGVHTNFTAEVVKQILSQERGAAASKVLQSFHSPYTGFRVTVRNFGPQASDPMMLQLHTAGFGEVLTARRV